MSASNMSITSSRREGTTIELTQELESVRTLNENLRVYLENIRQFRKNLKDVNENCKQLSKINTQWIDTISMRKD